MNPVPSARRHPLPRVQAAEAPTRQLYFIGLFMHFCSSTKRILSHSRKEKQELTNNAQVRFAANFLAPECPAARSRAPRSQAVPLGLVPPAAPPAPRSAARPARPAAPTPEAGPGGRAPGEEQGAALHAPPHPGPSCTRTPATPPSAQSKISGEVFASLAAPSITRGGYAAGEKFPPSCASLQPCAPGPGHHLQARRRVPRPPAGTERPGLRHVVVRVPSAAQPEAPAALFSSPGSLQAPAWGRNMHGRAQSMSNLLRPFSILQDV
ncbi:translation initiation factor IF-2 isoform X3 [Canis lupus dingo]|uniref:translation initiation factor IF-2 isoform X3 n=1 Tax=Canis lupus dingo TaxID=286419 RepID=UPI0020C3356B|nr:translation initiation factor IF-2 isoform X3 [Canis lupus dingo]